MTFAKKRRGFLMKIMRRKPAFCAWLIRLNAPEYGQSGGVATRQTRGRPPAAVHFNHKMKEHDMTWETPTAINFRYGFEITLYIANR